MRNPEPAEIVPGCSHLNIPHLHHLKRQSTSRNALRLETSHISLPKMSKVPGVARHVGRQTIVIIVAILLTVFPLPVLLSLLIPSIIVRLIAGVIARTFRPDLAGLVYGQRVLMMPESVYKKPKLTILLHIVFDGSLPVDKVRLAFEQKILNDCDKSSNLKYSHLQQTWTQFLGFFFWKSDKDFSLSHHIRNYDYQDKKLVLPDICTETDLKRVTADLISKPFKEGKSPWEMLVIPHYRAANNTSGKEQCVLAVRFHHALADGYSIIKLMADAFNSEVAKVLQPTFPKLSLKSKIWRGVMVPLRLPYDGASQLVDGFDWSNSWHLWNKKYSRKYHTFFSDQVPVDRIKEIKNKFGVSYNVATYAIAIGGIRRLMMEAGQKVPKCMSCVVPFPLPKHPGGLVVHASAFVFRSSPRIDCPAERIREISKSSGICNSNASSWPIMFGWAVDLLALLPVFVIKLVYNKLWMTLVLTSFPGPQNELETMGTAKMVDIIPALGCFSGLRGAVGVVLSVAGKQRFVITVDRVIFESDHVPVNLARHINDEVNDLLQYSEDQTGQVS